MSTRRLWCHIGCGSSSRQCVRQSTLSRSPLFLLLIFTSTVLRFSRARLLPRGNVIHQILPKLQTSPTSFIIAATVDEHDDDNGGQNRGTLSVLKLPLLLLTTRGGEHHSFGCDALEVSENEKDLNLNPYYMTDDYTDSSDGEAEGGEDEYEYDDDDDDIDDAKEDEATALHWQRRNLHRHPDAANPFDTENDSDMNQNPLRSKPANGRRPAPPNMSRPQQPKKKKKKKNVLTQLAQSSLSLSKKAAVTTVQTSGKAAYYLMRPKAIQESEIWGVWRLDQQVGMKQSTATIELTKRGDVIIREEGDNIIWRAPFRFVTPNWPKSCRVEFEARAFQPSNSNNNNNNNNNKPWLLFYKGYLERKVADPSVIKMVGKLYEIERPRGMFGKELPVRYNKIGSFVGRRRIVIEDDDDEYDHEASDFDDNQFSEDERDDNPDARYGPEADPYDVDVDDEEQL